MNHKKHIFIILIISISLLVTGSTSSSFNQERQFVRENQQFIRFHVIANSDSREDQEIKLKVRDRLLEEFGMELGNSYSLEDSRRIIRENISTIELAAQEVVDKDRPGHHVEAMLGYFDFPTKAYGDKVLPAGNYEALRVVIGQGQGANWWCVMFPPLCFVDISHSLAEGDVDLEDINSYAKKDDKNDSTKDYSKDDKVDDSDKVDAHDKEDGDEETSIEYRLKILEWWDRLVELF